jgi:hypothetical protein
MIEGTLEKVLVTIIVLCIIAAGLMLIVPLVILWFAYPVSMLFTVLGVGVAVLVYRFVTPMVVKWFNG